MKQYDIIKYPLLSEKSNDLLVHNQYSFCVDRKANKFQISDAIEEIYNVKVEKVNVINMPRKKKKYKFRIEGYTSSYKKAIVTLKEGDKIATT